MESLATTQKRKITTQKKKTTQKRKKVIKPPKNQGESKFSWLSDGSNPNICYVYLSEAHVKFLKSIKETSSGAYDFVNNIISFFKKIFKWFGDILEKVEEVIESFLDTVDELFEEISGGFFNVPGSTRKMVEMSRSSQRSF